MWSPLPKVTCRSFSKVYLSPKTHLPLHVLVIVCLSLALPAGAVDNDPYTLAPNSTRHYYPVLHYPIGLLLAALFVIGGYACTIARHTAGPLMGITSVLWLMMRNDSAIHPKLSWTVFGAWSFLVLSYFVFQCHRVSNHRLYMLLTMVLASICLCLLALVQKSSLQGGLVTALPPCTSFAAYVMAYIFPDRHRGTSEVFV